MEGGDLAEGGLWAYRQEGGLFVGVLRWDWADQVDAAVDRVQVATLDAVVDLVAARAEGEQLRARDDTVLPACELGDQTVNVGFAG
jgi:hypothetical protein